MPTAAVVGQPTFEGSPEHDDGGPVERFRRELDADPEAGRTRLLLPRAVGLIAPLRALPVPVFDRAMDVLGVNATMDGFTGRRSRLFAGRETAR